MYIEGDFIYAVEVKDKTSDDLAAETTKKAAVQRTERDKLLLDSDWTQIADSPYSGNVTWTNYRQALRDITVDPDWPDITFPTMPEK